MSIMHQESIEKHLGAQGRRMSLTAVFSLPDYKIAISKIKLAIKIET